jgi:two-component system, NtrC family, sensor kinase
MQARLMTIRLIRLAMAASLVLPCLLFTFASWSTYRSLHALARERMVRSLDIQQEEADKTFALIIFAMRQAGELVSGMSEADIRASESGLHVRLEKLVAGAAAVQSIWIYDKAGYALTTSRVDPPPAQSYADRDFVQAHSNSDDGIYYGQVYASTLGGEPYFSLSRRLVRDGEFVGILEVSVLPSNFLKFYSSLIYTRGLQYALLRNDGVFLARYPAVPAGVSIQLDEHTGFRRTIASDPEGGFYSSTSPVDHVEREYAIRRLGATPLYITAGIEKGAIRWEWLTTMGAHLIFGIPATLFLFLTQLTILRRTQRLYAETDRRAAAEETLRQSQRMEAVGHLTGGIAHDFNNLLTIIIGNLEGVERQISNVDAKIRRRVENALHGAQRAATLTKRLLAFSRQQPLSPTAVDINKLMNGLSDFLRRALGEEISLEIVGSAGAWPVEVDAAELESALVNLAVNARDAMPGGGKLTIEASNSYLDDSYCRTQPDVQPGQYLQLSVTDTGEGMAPDVVQRAFEPFFTTKPAGQGTGLGLSQVYGFVKQSGGHLKIYSEPGEGTTIKIYLRRFYGEPTVEDRTVPEPQRARSGECILVVEDDADVRAYVVETLKGLGYNVVEASNGDEALRQLSDHTISLLLTDVVMPGMNGRELAEQAKRRVATLRVLFMTGYSRNAIVHQGRLDPGVDLIQKPLTSDSLASAIRKILDNGK